MINSAPILKHQTVYTWFAINNINEIKTFCLLIQETCSHTYFPSKRYLCRKIVGIMWYINGSQPADMRGCVHLTYRFPCTPKKSFPDRAEARKGKEQEEITVRWNKTSQAVIRKETPLIYSPFEEIWVLLCQ